MDGELLPNKRVDRISELPEDIIVQILSFLPWKEAATTSILSHRWLDSWKDTPNLIFRDDKIEIDRGPYNYINWVNSVLKSYKPLLSLQEFTIVCCGDTKSTQHNVTKWLEFAFSRRVERLELVCPLLLFIDFVLEKILKEITISLDYYKSIKVLCLKGFQMSGFAIEFFLQNCPFLERLVIFHNFITSDLEVGGASLKHLDLRSDNRESLVKVSCPNLTWLTIDHEPKMVVLENVPKLVNMNIYLRPQDEMDDFANVAAQLETLIINLYDVEWYFSVPQMPKLKMLVVYLRSTENRACLPVICFLRACPRLEEFRLEISDLSIRQEIFHIVKLQPTFRHVFLKRFVLAGFCGLVRDRMELVRYIAKICSALEEIVIGECDPIDLVRSIVDYCVPLEEMFPRKPKLEYWLFAPTTNERKAFQRRFQKLRRHLRAHIKLTIL